MGSNLFSDGWLDDGLCQGHLEDYDAYGTFHGRRQVTANDSAGVSFVPSNRGRNRAKGKKIPS